MLHEILGAARNHDQLIQTLKANANYYPLINKASFEGGIYYSTLVRKCFDDTWYTIHVVDSYLPTDTYHAEDCLKRLMWSVYRIQYLYQLMGCEDIDTLQISEEERLTAE